jgi:pilus assembly protein CpaF
MSIAEQEELLEDICNDVLGYGPLEPLLARDDIADIMINGADNAYIEVNGKVKEAEIRFRDNQQLLNICQRIVSQVGRRVDESSPICDARLPDGSRVNVIAPPLAIDGTALTIRKFKKDKLTLDQLVNFGSISAGRRRPLLQIIGRVRCNVVISGGTGSGKTTLLNCLTRYIDEDERIITCEDSAELQLQQPHVVRLETRPPNLEGEGEITMRDLVKNCLRMRPERIIVGEVRGPEVFDLLQAMNTGHDGSMGTIHANTPRECLSRMESMIAMGGFTLPQKTVREIIVGSVDVIVQAARLRDGSRRITHITEVIGMEGDVIITQDLMLYDMEGEDANGKIIGRTARPASAARPCGIAPATTTRNSASPRPRCDGGHSQRDRATPVKQELKRHDGDLGFPVTVIVASSRSPALASAACFMRCSSPRSRTSRRSTGGCPASSRNRPTAPRAAPPRPGPGRRQAQETDPGFACTNSRSATRTAPSDATRPVAEACCSRPA